MWETPLVITSGASSRCRGMPMKIFATVLLLLPFTIGSLVAGTTGKVLGVVKNASTGETLPGASIAVEGTSLGTLANSEGRYFIINIPPGTYSLRVSSVGFALKKITRVLVATDLTTQVDVTLEPASIELGETEVIAERPLFQKDNTAKLSVVTSEELLNLPVASVQDVLKTKAGFTTDANGDVHARGGRTGEIAYLIDGQLIRDPLYGDVSNTLSKDAVQELSVVSGSFNAEYGQAMSSIVNIVTKDGGDVFHGKLEYTSPKLNASPYRKANAFAGVQDLFVYSPRSVIGNIPSQPLLLNIPINGTINASLSGPVPLVDLLTFFGSAKAGNENSWLPGGYDVQRDLLGKLSYRLSSSMKLSFAVQHSREQFQTYNHAWKYLLNNQDHTEKVTDRYSLILTHTLSDKAFYTVQVSHLDYSHIVQVGNLLPSQYVQGVTGTSVYFYASGDDSQYSNNSTHSNRGKIDATYQVNSYNQIKAGLELAQHQISVHEELEPWSGGAQFKDIYTRSPFGDVPKLVELES